MCSKFIKVNRVMKRESGKDTTWYTKGVNINTDQAVIVEDADEATKAISNGLPESTIMMSTGEHMAVTETVKAIMAKIDGES